MKLNKKRIILAFIVLLGIFTLLLAIFYTPLLERNHMSPKDFKHVSKLEDYHFFSKFDQEFYDRFMKIVSEQSKSTNAQISFTLYTDDHYGEYQDYSLRDSVLKQLEGYDLYIDDHYVGKFKTKMKVEDVPIDSNYAFGYSSIAFFNKQTKKQVSFAAQLGKDLIKDKGAYHLTLFEFMPKDLSAWFVVEKFKP